MTTTTDTFTTGANATLTAYGNGWYDQGNDWDVIASSDTLQADATNPTYCRLNTSTGDIDHYVQAKIVNIVAAQIGVCARMVSGAVSAPGWNNCYIFQYDVATSEVAIRNSINGVRTDAGPRVTVGTLSAGDVMRITVEAEPAQPGDFLPRVGITGYINDTQVIYRSTMTTLFSGTVGGLFKGGSTTGQEFDDFEQGLLSDAPAPTGTTTGTTRANVEVIIEGFAPAYLNEGTWVYATDPVFFAAEGGSLLDEDGNTLLDEDNDPLLDEAFVDDPEPPASTTVRAYFGYSVFGSGINMAPDITQLTINRGRSDELQPFRAGTLSFTLHDIARGDVLGRHWDPVNNYTVDEGFSSFRKAGQNIDYASNFIGEEVNVYALVDTDSAGPTRTHIFQGFIDTFQVNYHVKDRHSISVTATDGASKLAQLSLAPDVFRNGDVAWTDTLDYVDDMEIGTVVWTPSGDSPPNTWARTNHGLSNGNVVHFTEGPTDPPGPTPTNFLLGKRYYVVNVSGHNFQLSETSGGAAVTGTSAQAGIWTLERHIPALGSKAGVKSGIKNAWYKKRNSAELKLLSVGDRVWVSAKTSSVPSLYDLDTYYYIIEKPTRASMRLSATRYGDAIAGVGNNFSEDWTFNMAWSPPTFPLQRAADRISAILDCVSYETNQQVWPSEDRDITNSSYHMQPDELTGNVWAELAKVGESEMNNGVFISRTGLLRHRSLYRNRVGLGLVFSDDGTGTDIKYLTIGIPHNKNLIYNLVSLYRLDIDGVLGDVPESAEDALSQSIFGIKELARKDLLLTTDIAGDVTAQNHADFLVANYSGKTTGPTPVKQITVAVQAQPNTKKNLLFQAELMNQIGLKMGVRGGVTALDEDYAIDGISYDLTVGGPWTMTIGLSQAWAIPGDIGGPTDCRAGFARAGPGGAAVAGL